MDVSRDAYYKHNKREKKRENDNFRIVDKVNEIRKEHPRMGTKKLKAVIEKSEGSLKVGRDRLNNLLGERHMLVKQHRSGSKTTYSNHEYAVSPNRLKGLKVERPNQVFVGDITYLHYAGKFLYLYLITDLYSRKIVASTLGEGLEHKYAVECLNKATASLKDTTGIIYHSDRGSQYCCHKYKEVIKEKGMLSSMTDENHCYQNATAERVNGIIKNEYLLDVTFKDVEDARKKVEKAIELYNTKRPHRSLNMRVPADVYSAEF